MKAAAKKSGSKPTGKTVTIGGKAGKKPIKFKNDGSLTKLAGKGPDGKLNKKKVAQIAKGKGKAAAKARFYENVLSKGGKK